MKGELDWIVLRAVEKERSRRYDSAKSFAHDILRFLRDEPVQASPPSRSYRLKKFLRRNKGPVAAAAAVILALAGGLAASLWQALPSSKYLDDDVGRVVRKAGSFDSTVGANGEHGDTFDAIKLALYGLTGAGEIGAVGVSLGGVSGSAVSPRDAGRLGAELPQAVLNG